MDQDYEEMTIDDLAVEIAEIEADILGIEAQIESYEIGAYVPSDPTWRMRVRQARAGRRGDARVAKAILKRKRREEAEQRRAESPKRERREKRSSIPDMMQKQAEAHRAQKAKMQQAFNCAQAELRAVRQWVRENLPDMAEEIYAVSDAARARFDLPPDTP